MLEAGLPRVDSKVAVQKTLQQDNETMKGIVKIMHFQRVIGLGVL